MCIKRNLHYIRLIMLLFTVEAQSQSIVWQRCLGGSKAEGFPCVIETHDHKLIVTGYTSSNDGDVQGNHGGSCTSDSCTDAWVIKLDEFGNILWQHPYGGTRFDAAYFSLESNGNYLIAARTISIDGDVSFSYGDIDAWLFLIDSASNLIWQRSYGGTNLDAIYGVANTQDHGYIAVGVTNSNDGLVAGNHGFEDLWVLRLDSVGNLLWQKCLGGTTIDGGNCIIPTDDGNYLIGGYSSSNDGDVTLNHVGSVDFWIVKIDTSGNIIWQNTYGGTRDDRCRAIIQTSDGGFLLTGGTNSVDGDISSVHGGINGDLWVVKIDSIGNIQWQNSYGGTDTEGASSIFENNYGHIIITGTTGSNDGDVSGNHGAGDYWQIELDSSGNLLQQKCLGGFGIDWNASSVLTFSGSTVLVGETESVNSGDVNGYHGGYSDLWLVKLSPMVANINNLQLTIQNVSPNPTEKYFLISNLTGREKIELYSLFGILLEKWEYLSPNFVFDVSNFPAGMYFISINKNALLKLVIN